MRSAAFFLFFLVLASDSTFAGRWGGASIGGSLGLMHFSHHQHSERFESEESITTAENYYFYSYVDMLDRLFARSNERGLNGSIYLEYGKQYGWLLLAGRAEYSLMNNSWHAHASGNRTQTIDIMDASGRAVWTAKGTSEYPAYAMERMKFSWQANFLAKVGVAFDGDAGLFYGLLGVSQAHLDGDKVSTPFGISYGAGLAYALTQRWSISADILRSDFRSIKSDRRLIANQDDPPTRFMTAKEHVSTRASLDVTNVRIGAAFSFLD